MVLRKALLRSLSLVALTVCCVGRCAGGGGPKNVLLVINDNSPISQSVGAYYQQMRGIPSRNVCHIRCSTSEVTGKSDYLNNIAQPIRSFIDSSGIHNRIDYIVLTKGVPLTAAWTQFPNSYTFSVTSMLTCVGEPSINDGIVNPYGPTASPPAPAQSFSHQLDLGGKHYYAVTRLDARTEADIHRMINDAVAATPSFGLFLLDGANVPGYDYTAANNRLRSANLALLADGYTTYYDGTTFDSRLGEFVGGQQGVMGYFSWGSNEGSFTHDLYISNQFRPGSIADTYVSSSGRTFTNAWPPGTQSLIVDLIEQGACGVNGFVTEPVINCTTYPTVLFDRYVKGYNMAESFLAASPYLYWRAVTAGDPLMAPYATPPTVSITGPDPTRIAHGTVSIAATASDGSGVDKVEVYVDDNLAATLPSPPYQYTWDTTAYPDGTHTIEAIAYEDTDVYTQGMAKVTVQVINAVLDVPTVGGLAALQEGRLVRLSSKPVIAGSDAFTDGIYICEPDRSTGIQVLGGAGIPTGVLATVTGEVTTVEGRRVIQAGSVTAGAPTDLPDPVGSANLHVGNRGSRTDAISADLYPGLCNAGLLVKTWGYVTKLVDGGFLISDRSLPVPSSGLKVSLANLATTIPQPLIGSYVTVTGVSALFNDSERSEPTIRPRSASDIVSGIPIEVFMSPPGTLGPGMNLLSLPAIAVTPAPEQALAGIPIDGRLYAWNELTDSFLTYDSFTSDQFPTLRPGLGFWLSASESYTIAFEGLAGEPQTDIWVSLPRAKYALIGHTFDHPTSINNCYVSDGRQVIPIELAADSGWVEPTLYFWDNLHVSLGALDIGFGNVSQLEPWRGYWIKTYRPNLALLIPDEPG